MTDATMDRNDRKTLDGWVISDKMSKTRVVEVRWSKRDPEYAKVINRRTRVYVHDEKNESKAGDKVQVMATRPMSRTKRWRLVSVLQKSKI
jgi:small subunit ribosomal protein S17